MAFLIGGANTLDTGDFITNSLRFNDSDSAYLSITPSSAGNRRTFTYSGWIKTDVATASSKALLSCGSDSGSNDYIMFQSGDKLRFSFGTEGNGDIITTGVFRDPFAWYHFVWAVDTTQGTAANRVKLYVNGTQSYAVTGTYPAQNYDTSFNNTEVQRIGARAYSATQYYEGYMSDVYLIDGQQLDASSFGETNDNGVWIPKEYEGTYGTNGFRLEFKQTGTSANASGMGADTSGNGNHLTPSNLTAQDVTTDTPMNNFCTGNPLIHMAGGNITPSYSEGNAQWHSGGNGSYGSSGHGNFAVTNGKWYWELKIDAGRNNGVTAGIAPTSVFENHYGTSTSTDYTFARDDLGSYGYQFTNSGSTKVTGTSGGNSSSYGTNWSVDDIIGVAMDLDNDTLTFYLNGTSQGQAFSSLPDVYYTPAWYGYYNTVWGLNFGNAPFSISSGNSDANGYGNFEFEVPSGYYALCTKNLAEYG